MLRCLCRERIVRRNFYSLIDVLASSFAEHDIRGLVLSFERIYLRTCRIILFLASTRAIAALFGYSRVPGTLVHTFLTFFSLGFLVLLVASNARAFSAKKRQLRRMYFYQPIRNAAEVDHFGKSNDAFILHRTRMVLHALSSRKSWSKTIMKMVAFHILTQDKVTHFISPLPCFQFHAGVDEGSDGLGRDSSRPHNLT